MMNKEAIQQIQASAIASKVFELSEGQATAMPNDHTLTPLEALHDRRNRFRGKLNTTSIADWFSYVDDKGSNDSAVFIDKDCLSAKAIMDLGNNESPLHCEHKAILTLEKTPIYHAVVNANESTFNQSQMTEWLEDWAENLTVFDKDDDEMSMSEATSSIRRIEISSSKKADFEVNESSAKLSRSEQIEAKSRGKQAHSLRLTCVPYDGLEPVSLEVRLIVLANDEPKIRFRILRHAEIKESIAQDFKGKISNEVKDDINVYVGDFSE